LHARFGVIPGWNDTLRFAAFGWRGGDGKLAVTQFDAASGLRHPGSVPKPPAEPRMTITRFRPQEALICAMVLMGACDRSMSDAELGMMSRLVQELPAFADFQPSEISTVTEVCLRLLDQADGLDQACAMIRDALPTRLRETAYLLACEVAAADGDATQAELQFLSEFRIALDLDRLVAGAIERAAKARYQVI
jgi:tellurite resistance protein